MATSNVEILGIKVAVDTSELPKLQAAAKDAGVAVRDLADSNTEVEGKSRAAAAATDEHSEKLTHFSEVVGGSRREAGFLVEQFRNLAGIQGLAGTALSALESGIGGTGLAVVAFGAIMAVAKEVTDRWIESTKEEQKSLTLAAEYSEIATTKMEMVKASHEQATYAIDKNTGALILEHRALDDFRNVVLAESSVMNNLTDSEKKHNEEILRSIGANYQKNGSLYEAEQALAKIYYKTEDLNSLDATQIANLQALAEHWRTLAATAEATHAPLAAFVDDLDYINNAANGSAAQVQKMIDITGDLSAKYGDGGNIRAAGQKTPWEITLEGIKQTVSAQDKADRDKKAADDKATRDAEANQKILDGLHKEGAAVAMYAGEKGQQAYDMIANSALSAADKVALLHRWESQLPQDIRQKIQIYIDTQGLANLMALFGVRGPAGGHQQGNEWDFTFEGEDPATRKAFLDANGNNVEAARADWYAKHQSDLAQQGKEKPADWVNPYNPANSGNQGITGGGSMGGPVGGGTQVVIHYNAMGFHTADEEAMRAVMLPVMERINRELGNR